MAILVLVTVPEKNAEDLTEILIGRKLCACVNIVKEVESFFWWEGKINKEKESLLLIKTKSRLFSKLKRCIQSNHPYSVPEIIAFEIDKINKEYLNWLNKETSG